MGTSKMGANNKNCKGVRVIWLPANEDATDISFIQSGAIWSHSQNRWRNVPGTVQPLKHKGVTVENIECNITGDR